MCQPNAITQRRSVSQKGLHVSIDGRNDRHTGFVSVPPVDSACRLAATSLAMAQPRREPAWPSQLPRRQPSGTPIPSMAATWRCWRAIPQLPGVLRRHGKRRRVQDHGCRRDLAAAAMVCLNRQSDQPGGRPTEPKHALRGTDDVGIIWKSQDAGATWTTHTGNMEVGTFAEAYELYTTSSSIRTTATRSTWAWGLRRSDLQDDRRRRNLVGDGRRDSRDARLIPNRVLALFIDPDQSSVLYAGDGTSASIRRPTVVQAGHL
jgi:hypothetical protein